MTTDNLLLDTIQGNDQSHKKKLDKTRLRFLPKKANFMRLFQKSEFYFKHSKLSAFYTSAFSEYDRAYIQNQSIEK